MTRRRLAAVAFLAVGALAGCGSSSGGPAPASPAPRAPVQAPVGAARPLVATARWRHPAEGFRLQVRPTRYGRTHAAFASGRALSEALRAAGPAPLRLTFHLRSALIDQLRCHAAFAPRKPWWDLETWRPDVGYAKTVLALCNPT